MAVYTCNLLQKHVATGVHRPRLWADDENEALVAAYAVGASVSDIDMTQGFESYLITPEQQALAIAQGAKLCDYLEPRYQMAKRAGDVDMIRGIELSRRHGLTAGTHPKQAEAA